MNRFIITLLFLLGINVFPHRTAGDELTDLFDQGNAAFSSGDYVSSTYYFSRMIESQSWKTFPQRMDVLRKLAMIEESQAQFDRAVEHYRQMIDLLPETKDIHTSIMNNFYLQRYAENLERMGLYEQASEILWKVIRQSDSSNKQNVLDLLLDNYTNQKLTGEQIEQVTKQILPEFLDSLGWKYAELLYRQGRNQQSLEIFEKLWLVNPLRASEFSGTIAALYTSANQLDDLVSRIQAKSKEKSDLAAEFVLLEVSLLEEAGKAEEALKQLETFAVEGISVQAPDDVEKILLLLPGLLVDKWIDLIARCRGAQPAMQLLEAILKKVPMDLNRQRRLSALLIEGGRKEDAVKLWSQWAASQSNAPTSVLSAAQEIYNMGDAQSARDLLNQLKDSIPAPLAWRRGQLSLQFGDYAEAFASFKTASETGGVPASMMTSVIEQFAKTKASCDDLVASLINAASGQSFTSLPEWIKNPLLQYGAQPVYRPQLQALADADSVGFWKYNLACEAIQGGDWEWAQSLLESVAPDSLYRGLADQKRAEILGQNQSMVAQRQAADLMLPAVADILSASQWISSSTESVSSASGVISSSGDSFEMNPVLMDRLLKYAELRINAFQPNDALLAIHIVEMASGALEPAVSESYLPRIAYDRGRAYSELASMEPAIEFLKTVQVSPYEEDAQFLLARIYIAQRKMDEAKTLLQEIASAPKYWRRANDALMLLSSLDPFVGDSQLMFCDATLYLLQGRYDSAIPLLRQLAVEQYGGDGEEWLRFYIGKLKTDAGDAASAREEWERLLTEVDHPVIQGMIRLALAQLGGASSANVADSSGYQEIMIQLPNTIFSDLARFQMQRKFGKEQP